MLELWKTVVGEYLWTDAREHNARLAESLLAHAARLAVPGQGPTYPRLTHLYERERYDAVDIRPDLPPAFWQFLCAAVEDTLRTLRPGRYDVRPEHVTSIWPNVNLSGEFHRPHRHSALEHVLVGTYYVQVPPDAADGEGSLTLMDPRNTLGGSAAYRRFYNEGEIRLKVQPGYLVLFPPHVLHYVSPHRSSTPRLSVSFNVGIQAIEQSS